METFALQTHHLCKKFGGVTAVADLSLTVNYGEIFAFLGPNGAGKTTTIKLLTGLLAPTSGSAAVAGFDVRRDPIAAKRLVGLVTDQPFVYPHLTGFEFMRFIGDVYSVSLDEQKIRIPELLEMFDLSSWAGELVQAYSHGMRQKLVLASVLLHRPKVLFLDEPLVGLDPKSARLVKDVFALLAERGTAIFMCTHVLEIAEKLAHTVAIIDRGSVIARGSVQGLKEKMNVPANLEEVFLSLTGGAEYADVLKYLS